MINMLFQKARKHTVGKKQYKQIDAELAHVFLSFGPGLYLLNIKTETGLFGKLVGLFSGNFSHTVLVVYDTFISNSFTFPQWKKITESLRSYYAAVPVFSVATLIPANATDQGIISCDLSEYNGRSIIIRKLPANDAQQKIIRDYLVEVLQRPYDVTGLLGWLVKKWDDPNSYFCSELCYDACIQAGLVIAERTDPSPLDIELHCRRIGGEWDTYYYNI